MLKKWHWRVGFIAACLMLMLGVAGAATRAQDLSEFHVRTGTGGAPVLSHSSQWDAMDALVDLTGLWPSLDPEMDADPVMETSPIDGTVSLFWARWRGSFHEIVMASRPPGGAWSAVNPIETPLIGTEDRVSPRIVTDLSGYLHVIWLQKTPAGGAIYHSMRVGGSWIAPLNLSGLADAQRADISLVGTETRVVYWTRFEIVTIRITIFVSSGGSDDIDPVHVNTTELWHILIAK